MGRAGLKPAAVQVMRNRVLGSGFGRCHDGGVQGLSEHLFWDVDRDSIDAEKHASWLVQRVLEKGRWSDWQKLVATYGRNRLADLVTDLRSLEPRAFAFCRAWFDLPPNAFRCSASTPFPIPSARP